MSYWLNFVVTGNILFIVIAFIIHTGNPNIPLPVPITWPKYDAYQRQLIEFNDGVSITSNLRKAFCDFWDYEGYTYGF